MSDCTISGNSTAAGFGGNGGGVYNTGSLTITGSMVSDNSAGDFGGGIDNSGGTLTIADCTISDNDDSGRGGGGGIYNELTSLLTITDSTVSNNSASEGGGISTVGTLTLKNSTIAGNSAVGFGSNEIGVGGGIFALNPMTLTNCTIADNNVEIGGSGGGIDVVSGAAILENTIVALNTEGTGSGASASDIAGSVYSGSANNLIGTGGAGGLTPANDNQLSVADPGLDPNGLQDNGGPTQTIALLTSSPAVDAGSNALAVDADGNPVTTDQRGSGFPRIVSDIVDIGAFELQSPTVNNPTPGVSTIVPDEVAVGHSSPLTLTVTGSGFFSQSVVEWNWTALQTTYVSSTELTATVPATDFASKGGATIAVSNPTPGGGESTTTTFEVLSAPEVVAVDPAYAGDPLDTPVTLIGEGTFHVGYDAFGTIQAGIAAIAPHGSIDIDTNSNGPTLNVIPTSGNTTLTVTQSGAAAATLPRGDSAGFFGDGVVDIFGESGAASDVFTIEDDAVEYDAADGLEGTRIGVNGAGGLTREVIAEGTSNTFDIGSAGASGPSGNLESVGQENTFVFSGTGELLGNIIGDGTTTLDYADYATGVTVHLGNGTNGTATGVSGAVTGSITAVIGSNFNDTLSAGSVSGVALTGGLGTNFLSGTGAGDSVVESIANSYTLTNTTLTGTGQSFTDNLSGIRVADLTARTLGGSVFNVSGWTGSGSLVSSGLAAVTASKNANFTLTNSAISSSDGMLLGLSGIHIANLTVSASAGNSSDIINASAYSGVANLSVTGTGDAILYGGSGGRGTLAASGSGNDILIASGGGDALSASGSGHDILIGAGAGGDDFTGEGNDIFVSGTTSFDSDTSASIAALDAILAEWRLDGDLRDEDQEDLAGLGQEGSGHSQRPHDLCG